VIGNSSNMPTLVLIYFSVFSTFALWAHFDDLRAGKKKKKILLETAGTISLLVSAASFWISDFPIKSVAVIAIMAIFGTSIVLRGVYLGYENSRSDKTLSRLQNSMLIFFGVLLTFVVASPLIWWSFQSLAQKIS
jgi:hypothetical protein